MTGVLAIMQARSSSSRFPRKVLHDLEGAPMVLRQLERVGQAQELDGIVVATSTESSDDELADVLSAAGVTVRRGPLADVLGRFGQVVDEFAPEHVVRLTADCPLADAGVIDRIVQTHRETAADYTSNVIERTFAHGLDAEAFTVAAFDRLRVMDLDDAEHEHVTLGFYRRPEIFAVSSVTQSRDDSRLRWTVDYPADLEFVRAVYAALYHRDPAFDSDDVVAYLERHPELSRTVDDV
jgi:spore coat polysaccharide biosynthesis protein SpsF